MSAAPRCMVFARGGCPCRPDADGDGARHGGRRLDGGCHLRPHRLLPGGLCMPDGPSPARRARGGRNARRSIPRPAHHGGRNAGRPIDARSGRRVRNTGTCIPRPEHHGGRNVRRSMARPEGQGRPERRETHRTPGASGAAGTPGGLPHAWSATACDWDAGTSISRLRPATCRRARSTPGDLRCAVGRRRCILRSSARRASSAP